jgi:UDP-glucose:(heptosyl)LPS alpha-1,3-glucosyltransferase
MAVLARKPRVAFVSPFLDKSHGTERRVVEWISQLADQFEIHIYSQEIQDLDLSKLQWHRIPRIPGPHLFNYLWWFAANQFQRGWDRRIRGLDFDIVFSPGVNCLDADAVSVHIVFAEYLARNREAMRFARNSFRNWPALLHRKFYYSLIAFLESRIYTRKDLSIILIARRTREELAQSYGRQEEFPVIYVGLDHDLFNPTRRRALRGEARKNLGIAGDRFVLLLIGNDWRNKGVGVIFDAMEKLGDLPVDLLLVGREDAAGYRDLAQKHGLANRVVFCSPRGNVEFFYAAADAYVGPSLEDTFAQPPAEAMACGLPVVVSSANGTCEIINDGVDGLILQHPTDSNALASMIRSLCEDAELRSRLGANAAETARRYTWERNGRELAAVFQEILRRKANPIAQSVAQEL